MATISTIKPGGGGDFTTLQAWEDFADDEASAAQWAECYRGGDLGSCTISGWSATPDASNYPRVYTPLSERHRGRRGTGAFLSGDVVINEDFTRVEGLRVEPNSSDPIGMLMSDVDDILISGNLVLLDDDSTNGIAYFTVASGTFTGMVIRNNIIQGGGASVGDGIAIEPSALIGATSVEVEVYNNTIVGLNQYGIRLQGASDLFTADVIATVKNNVVLGSGVADYSDNGVQITISAANNNMSSDDTGDDWGASGAIINANLIKQISEQENFWRLRRGSDALNAAETLGSFSTDALDEDRPQNDGWDMGALEGPSSVPHRVSGTYGVTFQF